jgi:hypothetical protein
MFWKEICAINKIIQLYLEDLKKAMTGSDSATIQDAVADAHEHLHTALNAMQENDPELLEKDALQSIMAEYGSPEEIAAAYQQAEFYLEPYQPVARKSNGNGWLARFFNIFADSRAWGSFLYMVIAIITGTLFFSWVVTGLSLSLSLALFIFGLPFSVLFMLSVQGLGLLEGRIVEGLLGIRMPRRPLFFPREGKWINRLGLYLKDKRTWLSLVYLVLQLPLGVIYIVVWTFLVGLGLGLIAMPFVQEIANVPVIYTNAGEFYLPYTLMPVSVIGGILVLTIFMHLAKGIGKLHGKYAKWMLVAD